MGISPCSPIGIFDSGIGGLLIAKEIKNYMPNECIIYFGDTKNMPYGNKSKEFIRNHSMKIASFLYEKKCKAIVIACNSIVSNALDVIQKKFLKKILIFNVIEPIVKNKVLISSKRIGIMATPATIRSNFYQKNIKKYCPNLDIVQISMPLLATIIENGFEKKKINYLIKNYLNHFKSIEIDTLLLACTHYLFLKKEIDNFFREKVRIIDIQKIVVQEIKKKLYENNLLCLHSTWNNNPIFYTSSSISPFFNEQIKILFGKETLVKRHLFNFF
ncbi:glutamate racemase [Blattabacterium sp. (Blatta orientalis) str. Tarazona]|uniref:glutamate racemase n=1 Tax=Blattabacterium sp. (Blatta orientalis) TaxID=367806 RepID=UPI0002AD96BF|nr:glutamate racemase [Blattabacterium sp. (Blatta orientalis)]AGD98289.1 glutamate racemase [Blattabacterium sp. (Blatta orientalis) str. Tarazona]